MPKLKGILALASVCTMMSACYVVPVRSYEESRNNQQPVAVAVAAPRPVYTARLYPTNDSASAIGRITGTISNPERGHGEFAFTAGKESYTGEATRAPNASSGKANAAGNLGGFAKCEYTMSSAALGTGTCSFSNGARFDMHISL